jgi:hypothetical protein
MRKCIELNRAYILYIDLYVSLQFEVEQAMVFLFIFCSILFKNWQTLRNTSHENIYAFLRTQFVYKPIIPK